MNSKIITVFVSIRNDNDGPMNVTPLASSLTLSDGSSVPAAAPYPIISKIVRHENGKLLLKAMAGAAIEGAAESYGAPGDYTAVDANGNRTQIYDNNRLGDAVAIEASQISEHGAELYADALTPYALDPHETVEGLLYFAVPRESPLTADFVTLQLSGISVRLSVRAAGVDDGRGHETIPLAVSFSSLKGNTREDLAASLNALFAQIGKDYVKVTAAGDHLKTLRFDSSKTGDGLAGIKSSITQNVELLTKLRGVGFETIVITIPDGTATVEL
jgi:hypothetical protein